MEITTEIDPNFFPKGTHVVLVRTCSGDPAVWGVDELPVDHCYKLSVDSNTFRFSVEKDLKGRQDGWHGSCSMKGYNHLMLRKATEEEAAEYERLNKPFDVIKFKQTSQLNLFPIF